MNRRTTLALSTMALLSLGVALSGVAVAQRAQFGTADEAKAMLLRTVAAVKADKAKALDMIAKGEGGFLDRDLYPFCNNVSDGKIHPFPNPNAKQIWGTDARAFLEMIESKDSHEDEVLLSNRMRRLSRQREV